MPDDCCGPDVGVLSARQRLTEPQAYIVDPNNFFDILCCLATERYLPAKDQLATAECRARRSRGQTSKRLTADLEQRKKSIFDDYRGNISSPIDCDKYQAEERRRRRRPSQPSRQTTADRRPCADPLKAEAQNA